MLTFLGGFCGVVACLIVMLILDASEQRMAPDNPRRKRMAYGVLAAFGGLIVSIVVLVVGISTG